MPGNNQKRKVTKSRIKTLEKRDPEAIAAAIRAIARRTSARIKEPYIDHGELLYDKNGLPK